MVKKMVAPLTISPRAVTPFARSPKIRSSIIPLSQKRKGRKLLLPALPALADILPELGRSFAVNVLLWGRLI
jgi:hypothetical protein